MLDKMRGSRRRLSGQDQPISRSARSSTEGPSILTTDASHSRLPIWTMVFVGVACAAIVLLGGWREWASREATLREAEVETRNLARSLAQHAEDSIELADATVASVVARLEIDGADAPAIAKIQEFLRDRKPALGRVRGVSVFDADGRWLATTDDVDWRDFNNSDRDYFRYHRAFEDRDPHIGRPVRSHSGGEWVLTVSRRFNHPDGSFAGVVAAGIDASYFAKHYERFDLGAHGSISLMTADGVILARNPDYEAFVGHDISAAPLFKNKADFPNAGNYYFISPLDGRRRISFYERSARYPLVLLATEAQDDVLAVWFRDAIGRVAVVFAVTFLIASAGFVLIGQLLRRQRAQVAAATVRERLAQQTLIDRVPAILWVKDTNSRFLIANKAAAIQIGRAKPELLIGKNDFELHPQETAEQYYSDERRLIDSGQAIIDKEEYVLSPSGTKTWISTRRRIFTTPSTIQIRSPKKPPFGRLFFERSSNQEL